MCIPIPHHLTHVTPAPIFVNGLVSTMPRFSNTAKFENSDANVVNPERDRISAEGARGGFSMYVPVVQISRTVYMRSFSVSIQHPASNLCHIRKCSTFTSEFFQKMADPFQNSLGGHQINEGVVEMRVFLDVLRLRNGNGNLNKPPYQGQHG